MLEECSLSLLGRFLTTRVFNQRAAKSMLRSVWRLGSDLRIVDVGDDLFQFKFTMESQLKWVRANGPWSLEDHPLVLRRWERGMTATSVRFSSMPMWVQVWGLPFDLLVEEVGRDIGSGLGEVLEVDLKAFSSDQARFIRVRVELPLDKTLRRGGVVVSPEGDKVCIGFKYERLVGLCYQCGRIGHEVKECSVPRDQKQGCFPNGEWLKAGYCRNHGNANKARRSPRRWNDDAQAEQGDRVSSQWRVNEQGVPKIGSESSRRSSVQSDSLPKDGIVDGAPSEGAGTVEKDSIVIVKNHVPVFEEQISEIDRAIQTDSDFSFSKASPSVGVPDSSAISSDLIEVVVMDEDTATLNRGLMGKQVEQKSVFEGLEIGFKAGYGNVHGNRNNSKVRPKKGGNQDKRGSQSLHSPKKVEFVKELTNGNPIKSSVVDVEHGHKRKQTKKLIREGMEVKGEKKQKIVENEQGVGSTMGLMEDAGQSCLA